MSIKFDYSAADRVIRDELAKLGMEFSNCTADFNASKVAVDTFDGSNNGIDFHTWFKSYLGKYPSDFRKVEPPAETKPQSVQIIDTVNPWAPGQINRTEQGRITNSDPKLAAKLKMQAAGWPVQEARKALARAEALAGAGKDNPWIPGPNFNRTEQARIINSDPARAEKLKAEAKRIK